VKTQGLSPFNAFGLLDARGAAYKDMCGVVGTEDFSNIDPSCGSDGGSCRYIFVEENCMGELGTQIITYLVIQPFVEALITFLLPWVTIKYQRWKAARRTGAVGSESNAAAMEQEAAAKALAAGGNSKRARLLSQITNELTLAQFKGTFDEYTTKVLQFGCASSISCMGWSVTSASPPTSERDPNTLSHSDLRYIAMFSSAVPVVAVAATLANILELRLDAYKMLYQLRRPRFKGAADIGKWRLILHSLSWLAIVVNAAVLVFSSTALRDRIVIPSLADSECAGAQDAGALSDEARALGLNISWASDCVRNYLNCYAKIGGVAWLRGVDYLSPEDTTSRKYVEDGLCSPGSPLFHVAHCKSCKARRGEVSTSLMWGFIVIEHTLILAKLLIWLLMPGEPRWVTIERARTEFRKEALEMEVSGKGADPATDAGSYAC
jgi:hypothetical protein